MAGKYVYYKRNLEDEIRKYLSVKEIIAVVGIRQCGKTTLLKKIVDDLKQKHSVNFLSFDDVTVLRLFQEDIDSFIELHVKPFDFLFIDEIQYALESGKQLKYIYDNFEIKIFVSGSSAPAISVQSIKYLVGRIFTFTLHPFSFHEFLRVKDENILEVYQKGAYKSAMVDQLNRYLQEYLLYGGFPRVVTASDIDEKKIVLKNIYNTYLLREIRETFQIADNIKVVRLLKLLALQIGDLVNLNKLSSESGFKLYELKKFLDILESTFVITHVFPYYSNKRTELVKTPKIYFTDSGFRNVCLENYSEPMVWEGKNIEQFANCEFQKRNEVLKFWRSKSQAEVDFVLERDNLVPIEIKSTLNSPKLTRSFHSFLSKYDSKTSYVLSKNFEDIYEFQPGKKVHFLPWVKLNMI